MNQNLRRSSGHGRLEGRIWSRKWVPITAIVIVTIAVTSSLFSLSRASVPDDIDNQIFYEGLASSAVEGGVDYNIVPPAGGNHAGQTFECGVYSVPVKDEEAVAALATGAVWFTYQPGLDEVEVENLMIIAEGELDTFMSPYPDLPEPIVITAWGVQYVPDSATDPAIITFMREHRNSDRAPSADLSCRADQPVL